MGFLAILPGMHEPDHWTTPEWAIRTFEELTGLAVTVHEVAAPPLWPYLPPERFRHHAPCCLAVKANRDWACLDFEVTRLREEILTQPEGRYHTCHAGLMEWAMPVFRSDRLIWVLFAGQAQATGAYTHLVRDIRNTPAQSAARARLHALPHYTEGRAQSVLEALRQLRARLLGWHREGGTGSDGTAPANRRLQIQNYLHLNHHRELSLEVLARHLSLSPSRTSHLVRELFGCGYAQLLQGMRLKTAASMLRNSELSVMEVCLASGFQDLSHFHKIFRQRFGMTPRQYRLAANP